MKKNDDDNNNKEMKIVEITLCYNCKNDIPHSISECEETCEICNPSKEDKLIFSGEINQSIKK